MHTFVKVVAGFPVSTFDVVRHMSSQELAGLVEKGLIVVGKSDS